MDGQWERIICIFVHNIKERKKSEVADGTWYV
jgi:hypothetical protein